MLSTVLLGRTRGSCLPLGEVQGVWRAGPHGEVGHQRVACPTVKRRKVQPSASASNSSGSSLSTTVSSDGAAGSVTLLSTSSKTTKGGISHSVYCQRGKSRGDRDTFFRRACE